MKFSTSAGKVLLWLVVSCWLLVTFAALAAMYQLWWQRERVLYMGKSVAEQRQVVFQRAGFPPVLAAATAELERLWPADCRYKAQGDATSLSYIKYLLIPRLPMKDAACSLVVKGGTLTTSNCAVQQSAAVLPAAANNPAGLILSFAVLLGWAALIRQIWRKRITWPESLALACLFFTLLVLPTRLVFLSAKPAFAGSIVLALVGWAMLISNALIQAISSDRPLPAVPEMRRSERLFAGLLVLIILLGVFWSLIMAVVVVPDDWDAWAIWGSKAKTLALGTGPLEDVTRFGHPDYPLLWPTIWAFSGWLSGGWEECWSKGWGVIFLTLCVWEMVSVVRQQSGSLPAGLLAAALFVSIPNVPLIASWSYAEAPLWLMMTCGLASFLRWQNTAKVADAVLAGLFAAAAAYTKNEGLLFAVLLGLLFFFSRLRSTKVVIFYLMIFSGCYFFWFWWYRLHLDLGSSTAAGLHHLDAASLHRAFRRIIPAGKAIFGMWKDVRQWNIVLFWIGLTVIGTLFSPKRDVLHFFLPTGLLAGYFLVILCNAEQIYWQIGTAWNRLTVQIMPLLLVLLLSRYSHLQE